MWHRFSWLDRDFFRGKRVIDFGSGAGHLCFDLSDQAAEVIGLECRAELIAGAARRAAELGLANVRFLNSLQAESQGLTADLILSMDSMEHFTDPAAILLDCASRLQPGGAMLIAFGPPWRHPFGAHLRYMCPLPWFHLLFPERTILRVRRRYRSDGATRFGEVSGGLNQMTCGRFRRLIAACPFALERLEITPIRRLAFLARLPGLRELVIAQISCLLRKMA